MTLSIKKPYSLTIEIPALPAMTNPASGTSSHWRVIHKERKRWHELVALYTVGKRPEKPLKYFTLTLTRFSSKCPDYDGLTSGFKAVADALKISGIIEDDTMENTGAWNVSWQRVAPKAGKIQVVVQSVEGV